MLLKVARLDGTAAAYVPSIDMDGERIFLNLAAQGVGPDEKQVDEYVTRARKRDSDLWVVEIEDREVVISSPSRSRRAPETCSGFGQIP